MNKEARENLIIFGMFLLIIGGVIIFFSSTYLVLAGPIARNANLSLDFWVNEGSEMYYNITINNSNFSDSQTDIIKVTIAFPSNFSFTASSNFTNSTNKANVTFSNTSTVLTWQNSTVSPVILHALNSTQFLFNLTANAPGAYNLTITTYNTTASNVTTITVTVNDTQNPKVSNFVTAVSGGNYSGVIVLNVTANDTGIMDSVYFNITGPNGSMINYTKASSPTTPYYNISLNTLDYSDGIYNIIVYANDTKNNQNKTTMMNMTIDNTAPSAVTLTSSSATSSSLTLAVAVTDALSGGDTCTSDRDGTGNVAITGTGSGAQTLTETGLTCGVTYSYIVTCLDFAGNSKASSSTSFTTDSCSAGGSISSGGTSTTTWTNTIVPTTEELTAGVEKTLGAKERVKVMVGTGAHYVGVKSLTTTSATIEISSDPVTVQLDVGEDAKVDVDSDGTYDVYVKLNSITNNKADVTVQKINEAVPAGEEGVQTSGEEITGEDETTSGGSKLWIWIVVIVLLVAIGAGYGMRKK